MCYRMMDTRSDAAKKSTESQPTARERTDKIESAANETATARRVYLSLMDRLQRLLAKDEHKESEKESAF